MAIITQGLNRAQRRGPQVRSLVCPEHGELFREYALILLPDSKLCRECGWVHCELCRSGCTPSHSRLWVFRFNAMSYACPSGHALPTSPLVVCTDCRSSIIMDDASSLNENCFGLAGYEDDCECTYNYLEAVLATRRGTGMPFSRTVRVGR